MTCHHCGQDIPKSAKWDGLEVRENGDLFWRGVRRLHLTPLPTRVMLALARRGEATHLALEMQSSSVDGASIPVQMVALRRKLKAAEVPIRIVAIKGYGYRLELESPE